MTLCAIMGPKSSSTRPASGAIAPSWKRKNGQRRYAFRDVIGPDEYHDHVDNNVYTNRMAQWHLQTALSMCWTGWTDDYPDKARASARAA